jgi:hypothetical protein
MTTATAAATVTYEIPMVIVDDIYERGWQDGYSEAVKEELEEAQTLAIYYYMQNKQALDLLVKWRDVMNDLKENFYVVQWRMTHKDRPDFETYFKFTHTVLPELEHRFELDSRIKEIGERLEKVLTEAEAVIHGALFH